MSTIEARDNLERAIIGLAMKSAEARADMHRLKADHFETVQHRALWGLIQSAEASGAIVSPVSILRALETLPVTERQGVDADYLTGCVTRAPSRASAAGYAKELMNAAGLSALQDTLTRCQQLALASTDAAEITELVRAELDAVVPDWQQGRMLGDGLADTLASYREESRITPTPWSNLNHWIGGWRPGALYVIAARPGVGKTLMGVQAALALAKEGPVALHTLEMPEREVHNRIIAHAAQVNVGHLKGRENGRDSVTASDWDAINDVLDTLDGLPVSIDARPNVLPSDIRAHARALSRQGELAGIVVDYLQLMDPPRAKNVARHEMVAKISRSLKEMAKEFDCPVIALSQLNRASEARGSTGPSLGDIRESGAIEQDADVVILLNYPKIEGKPDRSRLLAQVAKNRHGKAGDIAHLIPQGWYSTVLDDSSRPGGYVDHSAPQINQPSPF